jgi:hypothetical protein
MPNQLAPGACRAVQDISGLAHSACVNSASNRSCRGPRSKIGHDQRTWGFEALVKLVHDCYAEKCRTQWEPRENARCPTLERSETKFDFSGNRRCN